MRNGSRPDWIWEGKVVHKIVGEGMAMALIKYDYRPKLDDEPLSNWLTFVFELQDGEWRILHNHNTSLDFPAFARTMGIWQQARRRRIFSRFDAAEMKKPPGIPGG